MFTSFWICSCLDIGLSCIYDSCCANCASASRAVYWRPTALAPSRNVLVSRRQLNSLRLVPVHASCQILIPRLFTCTISLGHRVTCEEQISQVCNSMSKSCRTRCRNRARTEPVFIYNYPLIRGLLLQV